MADEEPAATESVPQPAAEAAAEADAAAEDASAAEQPPADQQAEEVTSAAEPDAAPNVAPEDAPADAPPTEVEGGSDQPAAETEPTDEGKDQAEPAAESTEVEPSAADAAATADGAEAAPVAEGETQPAEGGEKPAEGDEKPVEGDEKPVEGDEQPAEASEKADGEEGDQSGEAEQKADAEPAAESAEGAEGTEGVEGVEGADGAEGTKSADGAEGVEAGDDSQPAQEGVSSEQPTTEEGAEETPKEANMPQSDTFTDGEKPESPTPHVGEVLSREGSPQKTKTDEEEREFSPPVPDSPRESHHEEHFDVDVLEEEIISPEQDREALVEMYHGAIAEREQLQQQNHQLQHKLAEYFKKKKSDEQKAEAVDKNEADQEQRYLKYMSQLEELRTEDQEIRDAYAMEIAELEQRCEEKKQEVDAHKAKFVEFKHQVALNALNSRSGKPIPPKDIEQYLSAEDKKDQEVIGVRLENIKLKNKLKKKEQQLKSKEELADGLHLIDFEQLKIENQTYNEKIEERNEELLKLRKKITNTVQVLTHLKEKLQFVQGENSLLKNKLKDVEGAVAQKRDVLTRTKQARDALRIDNHRLRQNCGLLGNEPLLRDFEERKDEADALKDRLERLKMQHAELTLNTSSVRRKIEQIKANEST